jgi:hypothetical protein
MSKANDITPAKFRCAMVAECPSIHEHESGDIILVGQHVSRGELKNMEIANAGQGEGAIRLSREFMDAYFMEYAAKRLTNAK